MKPLHQQQLAVGYGTRATCPLTHQTQAEAESCNECHITVLASMMQDMIYREAGRFRGLKSATISMDFVVGVNGKGVVDIAFKVEKAVPFENTMRRKIIL